ncbi:MULTISPECIES: glycoside hydrolase family 2 TIM barrel-domain containing protein [unclassified Dysgonomonas]|uniref:glycoside hydrolase family 2 TIM barrel-domain containing protein n=1 Tax=unclassified Dysgonomonas TaxID=2630389 RepID=UPI0025BD69B1|nr:MULTISPECIES: glycoside hydrolase family 2 TIM barrel-domain containing protein [unclassified Dysgonomonas]HMM03952.1 glycoside hydrolase family 2 TIM barrel-domain containing protein [Dysgonomonas sp.]
MKRNYFILFFIISFVIVSCQKHEESQRARLFDENWLFHYGDIPNGQVADLYVAGWTAVDLPHDWSVEMPFAKSEGGIAIGQTQGGTAWYRKIFVIPESGLDKRQLLYFEGVYMESEVWVNGRQVSFHPYGYTSFFCDITELCNPVGRENTVAVKVKNEGRNSRWYAGSGIYRHVWLITTDKLHLDEWATSITTDNISDEKANVNLSIDVFNKTNKAVASAVTVIIKDSRNNLVQKQKVDFDLNMSETKTVSQSIEISKPDLWSVDSPTLYTATILLESGGKLKDMISIPFGIRSISFSAKDGFLLNGKSLKLKGGCVHHDNGLLGAVAIDRAEEKKVELLKANGFNAVRCAHNPPSEKFLEACDRLGILVIDEAFDQWQKQKNPGDYHRFFDEWHEKDLASMVLRDRNHPSVIMWSIGNEIQERSDTSGVIIAQRLKEIVRKYDKTRPVTAAINDYWDNPNQKWKTASPAAFGPLDVGGYNYMWWEYEHDTKLYPERIIYGSETTAMERAVNWDLVEKYPSIIGDFIWTAIDYLGESGIGHAINIKEGEKDPPQFLDWPWFNAWCGDIDICGYKKPQSALRDVLWNESKIEILVHNPIPAGWQEKISYWGWPDEDASWNWKGYEDKMMDVKVYARYPSVRLYLNGKQLEEKATAQDRINKYSAHFKVKYEPGTLKAAGIGIDREKESAVLVTTGIPLKIRLKPDRSDLKNSKNDLSYVQIELIDKDGNIVPDSDTKLELSISGNGKILAAGNACPTDMDSFRSLTPKTYKGKALAIIQPNSEKGQIILNVKTQEYGEQSLSINTQ